MRLEARDVTLPPKPPPGQTKAAAAANLPKLGEVVWKKITAMKDSDFRDPMRGKVVYVNHEHLWYLVQFDCGFRECYKPPEG